ncbi:hypothetical protein DW903_12060 [Ruminococcus sp. AM42-10AC]|nr:hypothetical protein DWZ49_11170 [Ruminococcus sp. AF33-11BH]RHT01734.1 hypothetical protein DW903_12060 [Ruminococcus sp. AM42-10AC]RHT12377.1 hypothetical protein DW842_08165 [Ruminococcus sp. AM36-17]
MKNMRNRKKLPIGIDSFEKIIRHNFYYVDKTEMITELLHNWGEVNLFTRPRRFGKSLNMNMLQSFLEIGCDKSLFNGLKVSREKELCEEYMGKFPVISLTLKNVEGLNFESARKALKNTLGMEAWRLSALTESSRLTEEEKNSYKALTVVDDHGDFKMSDATMEKALLILTVLLEKHYGKKAVLLIDEYDVPLDKAFQYGYYDEMVSLIRNMFGNVLKTNSSLFFAVLTGCLRIAKESIFTGLNNFNVFSITSVQFDEFFGFTDDEVAEMLKYFGLSDYHETIREWYDGYQFGKKAVYCPWDVISYCRNLCADPDAIPEDFWSNTSSNSIVSRFIDKANKQTRDEIENLISGETVIKEIKQELTYNELDKSIENLWSILFTTGYLTQRERIDSRKLRLAIPNREIKELFELQIREWFQEKSSEDVKKLDKLCMAFPDGDAETIEDLFNDYLWNTISIRDTAVKGRKENFYHGVLLGLLSHMENWAVWSNIESGEGYCDILLEVPENRVGVVIEMKYAQEDRMEAACTEALKQIEQRQYAARLKSDGMKNIVNYGIACYRKHCKVKMGKENS